MGLVPKNGKDFDGRFERMFQLEAAFPSIELGQYAGRFERWLHAAFFRLDRNAGMRKEDSVRRLKGKFHPIDIDTCKNLLTDIKAQKIPRGLRTAHSEYIRRKPSSSFSPYGKFIPSIRM